MDEQVRKNYEPLTSQHAPIRALAIGYHAPAETVKAMDSRCYSLVTSKNYLP